MLEEIKAKIYNLAEEDYRVFNSRLLPGVSRVLGVRLPAMRKLAKKTAKGDFRSYLKEAQEKINADSIHEEVMSICSGICHDGYYVKMAVAWTLQVCYVKFPGQTRHLLENNCMDNFTHNKAIQKIRESYQVSREEKEKLNRLKRK